MNIIEIRDLTFSYKNKKIFDNLNLNLKDNTITTILGPNGSGKTTLAQLIISDNKKIQKNKSNIYLITTNPDNYIIEQTVEGQLMFYLKQNNIKNNIIEDTINKITKEFNLEEIINIDPYKLNNEEKQMIIVLSIAISNPDLIVLDDALCFISKYNKDLIFKYFRKQKIPVINFTNNTEECLYSNYVVIINKQVIINKTLKKALQDEKAFNNNNLQLPFIAELSNKLKYYNLLDDVTLKKEEMVEKIWK